MTGQIFCYQTASASLLESLNQQYIFLMENLDFKATKIDEK